MKKILVLSSLFLAINSYASEPQLLLTEHLDKMPTLNAPQTAACMAYAYNTSGTHGTSVPISGAYGYNLWNSAQSGVKTYYLDVYLDVNSTNIYHYKYTFSLSPNQMANNNNIPINTSMVINTPGNYPVQTTTMISGAESCKIMSPQATVNVK